MPAAPAEPGFGIVVPDPAGGGGPSAAWLSYNGAVLRCAIGRTGVQPDKREGDGGTPPGRLVLRRVLYRADRGPPPACRVPVEPIARDDGWCDDADHPAYNRPVRLPFAASHEELWREDRLYDLIGVLGWNDDPPVRGRGSAIFLHVAAPDFAPTAGCVSLPEAELRRLLASGLAGLQVLAA
ncbi:L,D-transpeptidase family protein [Roseomonas sp. NAR14]|uniref:L,D-transpeptidase family protein n=1 Tax=Roseomonas acroporae TaxID=2937791 RepID=A0A9X1YAC5_9PROT|nr:L,D-transpeptidase family protein [Roseomonas acroporae]MCK8786025.1 L,D-transpeptidase family protein [Roseomonas acroporae]